MRVIDLIKYLQEMPPEMIIAYTCCSEQILMELEQITVKDMCFPRPDGWVQNKRPDMPSQTYLLFPGN